MSSALLLLLNKYAVLLHSKYTQEKEQPSSGMDSNSIHTENTECFYLPVMDTFI